MEIRFSISAYYYHALLEIPFVYGTLVESRGVLLGFAHR
jgi:hypothetical protein